MLNSGFVFTGQSGCFLPALIILNLLFGKLIFGSTRLWLGIEAVLIILFILKIHTFIRKIHEQLWRDFPSARQSHKDGRNKSRIIDIKGEVLDDKKNLQ